MTLPAPASRSHEGPQRAPGAWVEIASPSARRPMTKLVDRAGAPLRALAAELAPALADAGDRLRTLQAPRASGLGYRLGAAEAGDRAAWWLIGQWLCGYAMGELAAGTTLRDAEDWFGSAALEAGHLAPIGSRVSFGLSPDETWALLPYLLDPAGPGTRRQVIASDEHRPDRRRRKQSGIYYTPADVARHMARQADVAGAATALDPAVGTAVFLRAALVENPDVAVFGIDVDPLAIEMSAFVLLATTGTGGIRPLAAWHRHRLRLAVVDALTVRRPSVSNEVARRARLDELLFADAALSRDALGEPAPDGEAPTALPFLFPELRDGADAILSNPPYAALGPRHDFGELVAHFDTYAGAPPTTASNIFMPFVELGWKLSSDRGTAAFIVPLSLAYGRGRQFRRLRAAMAGAPGGWSFAFFDRTPDAIFGDDVKTRAAIATRTPAADRPLRVTELLRWTSRTRAELWDGIEPTALDADIGPFIPKLGTSGEADLYRALRSLPGSLADDVERCEAVVVSEAACDGFADAAIFVAPTAYNWIGCTRDARAPVRHGHDSASPLTMLTFGHAELADAAYAVLASRLTFWLWRVEGDAFHVQRSFLTDLPFALGSLDERALGDLAAAGRALWESASAQPITAVNKGRRTVAFSSAAARSELRAADDAVAAAFGVRDEHVAVSLDGWHRRLVVVDEGDARRNPMLKEPIPC